MGTSLTDALDLEERELVSFVGAGGKKTAMSYLVDEAAKRGYSACYTTTAHMPPPDGIPLQLAPPDELADVSGESVALARERVANPERVDSKVRGYEPETFDALHASGAFDWLLVKADGARMREFKAPDPDEPPIPKSSTAVVVVASVRAVGRRLDAGHVHRPERVAALDDCDEGDLLTPEMMAAVLAHDRGGRKNVPPDATLTVLLNKADTSELRATARTVLDGVFERTSRVKRGVVASLREGDVQVVRR